MMNVDACPVTRYHRSLLLGVFIAIQATAAAGQALPATQGSTAPLPTMVTLDDVLTLLAERSPRTVADHAPVDVVAADRITANTMPNPSISYGGVHLLTGLSTGATTQHQIVVEQPLLLFHQRGARLDAADMNVRAKEAEVAETLAQRRLSVRQAFASLLARQEQARVTQDSLADLESIEQVVRGRAQAGDRSQYDVVRIETETETLRVQLMNVQADLDDASGQLAALLGFPGWSPRAVGRLDVGNVPTDFNTLWEAAQVRRPALVAIRQEQTAARGGLFLARRERLPVPAISAGSQVTQDVHGISAFFGFSLPLQLFDHNQGAIARATAQIEVGSLTLDAEMAEARAEIERTATVLTKRRDALTRLESEVVQRAPMLRRMAEDAYREGSADILELLDAMRSLKDIQVMHVQQLESVKLAEEQVVSAAGLDAPPASQ